jgi:acyl-CoA thioester hydrolase
MVTAERIPPSGRGDFAQFYVIQTRWQDNDAYRHMNNVVHYSLFDTAVNGWLLQKGLMSGIGRDAHIGIVVESGCRYHGEMAFPDIVTAGLRVSKLGTSSVRYEIGLFRNEETVSSADGRFIHVYVDAETRRPVPLTDAMRSGLAVLLAPAACQGGHGGAS